MGTLLLNKLILARKYLTKSQNNISGQTGIFIYLLNINLDTFEILSSMLQKNKCLGLYQRVLISAIIQLQTTRKVKVKVQINFALQQAMKAHRGGGDIDLLFP
jgi:hypothetical protein